ncbi:MAG: hypothetical protein AAF726_22045 [Planctomycetota bacterium]
MSEERAGVRVLVAAESDPLRSAIDRQLVLASARAEPPAQPDPFLARDLLVDHRPDLVHLDVEMPRWEGLDFIRELMGHEPAPTVVICSPPGTAGNDGTGKERLDIVCIPSSDGALGDFLVRVAEWIDEVEVAGVATLRPRG